LLDHHVNNPPLIPQVEDLIAMDTLDKNQVMEAANKILTEEEFREIHTEINNIEINTNLDLNTLTKNKK